VAGGAAEVLLVSLNCSLPLRRTHPATLVFMCLCSNGSNQHKIWTAGGESVYLGSGVGKAIWEQFYFQLFQISGDFA